jgi:hypothetical protein
VIITNFATDTNDWYAFFTDTKGEGSTWSCPVLGWATCEGEESGTTWIEPVVLVDQKTPMPISQHMRGATDVTYQVGR